MCLKKAKFGTNILNSNGTNILNSKHFFKIQLCVLKLILKKSRLIQSLIEI